MSKPRYAIIPAGAVVDPDLEGNDLRVLCYLGTHTDKLGWCFLSQGKIAAALGIGRATVQRSLARLVTAGYVEVKSSTVSGRPHACHAYRVIMDRDDPEIGPSELEVEDQEQDGGCPPAGTSGAQPERARVPAIDGHGVPTHTRAQKDPDSVVDVGVAREAPMISEAAQAIAFEIATIAGHNPDFLPANWISYGPAMRVQMGLNLGWQRSMMIETAKAVMVSKRDGPPRTIKYFEGAFATAHERQSSPSPLPQSTNEEAHRVQTNRGNGQQNFHSGKGRGFAAYARDRAKSAG